MAGVLITYQGTTISNLTASGTRTLLTAGKYCEANIGIDYTAAGADIEVTSALGTNAFKSAVGLTSISVNNNTTAIGESCFNGCTGLTTVSGFASLTTIGKEAFRGCTALTTLPTAPTITSIGESAFYGCTSLVKFEMPTNVTALNKTIFQGCSALTDIVLHGTVTNFSPGFGNSIANNCTSLLRLTLPGGSYGDYVLYNNTSMRYLTLGGPGSPVSSIGNSAFYHCTGPVAITVYTAGGQELSHAAGNYWGCNNSGTTCTFIDSTITS